MSKVGECPKCGDETTSEWYGLGRKLRDVCTNNDCNWAGETYTPDVRPISTTEMYTPLGPGGWRYTAYDGYGHIYCSSRSYGTREECLAAAREDVRTQSEDPSYGKCSAVVWPPRVIVTGELVE